MTAFGPTTSQTVGPFFHDAMLRDETNILAGLAAAGERIRVEGYVFDGDGAPVPDAVVEIWQANAHGRYHHPADRRDLPHDPAFTGFGRSATDADGHYWFETVRPGAVPFDAERRQAPHVNVTVFARGLLDHLATRMYFPDEVVNESDPLLSLVPSARRATLIASRDVLGDLVVYRWDVRLQGDGETAFFNL